MKRFFTHTLLGISLLSVLVGCKSTDAGNADVLQAPPGWTPLPPVTSELPPNAPLPPPVASAAASADTDEVKKVSWWRQWMPTNAPNDPTRERGEYKDGFIEPDYRGISD